MVLIGAAALPSRAGEGAAARGAEGGAALPGALAVKFSEGQTLRLRDGKPSVPGVGVPAGLRGVLGDLEARGFVWDRAIPDISEEKLDELRGRAGAALGRPVADQNLHFVLRVPAGEDAAGVARLLNDLPEVQWAAPAETPPPPPQVPPDLTPQQGYAMPAPGGVGAWAASAERGATGAGVTIADIEYSWNLLHADLPAGIELIGPPPIDPFGNTNHGTAVLGVLVSLENGFGTTGLAPHATAKVVAANTFGGYSVAAAINRAVLALSPGDIILIEQQTFGPNYTGVPAGTQRGLVPSEWNLPTYDAVATAVGNGFVVVAAAGNGEEDLDGPAYSTGNGGHHPFLPENDSGAIIVGAGRWSGGPGPRQAMWFTNYGSRIDVQGWGERVATTGYGNAYDLGGPNQYYTGTFSGTSSASAVVAAAAAALQSVALAERGAPLWPAEVRAALRSTGTPQPGADALSRPIGPLPDVLAAAALAVPPHCPGDANGDRTVDFMDITSVLLHWGTAGPQGDADRSGAVDAADITAVLMGWGLPCP